MLKTLIHVGINGYYCIYFPRNSNKIVRSYILGACLLCIPLIIEGLRTELTMADMSSPVLELFIVLIHQENPIHILFGTSEAIHLGIWVYYWSIKNRPIFSPFQCAAQGSIYIVSYLFLIISTFHNHHGYSIYWSIWSLVDYCCSIWSPNFYLCRLLFILLR